MYSTLARPAADQEIDGVPTSAPRAARRFLLALLLATWTPLLFFVALTPAMTEGLTLGGAKSLLLFFGTAHVPATLFFYTDRGFAPIVREHKFRYVYVPVLLTVVTGFLYASLSGVAQAALLLFYWVWQAFHYGRQNIGVYAFASIAQTNRAPHKLEKAAIDAGTLLGILGTFKIMGAAVSPAYLHPWFDALYQVGHFAFAAAFVFALAVYVKHFRETTLFKTLFYFTSVFFFYPVFMSTEMSVAFLSYAVAHGAQYLVFMSIVAAAHGGGSGEAAAEARRSRRASVLVFVALTLIVGFVFFRVGDLRLVDAVNARPALRTTIDFLVGVTIGATMAHFVVDAGAWKLSLARQREYVTGKFGFIFARRSS